MTLQPDPLETAVALHREGRLVEAVAAYRLAIQAYPQVAELYYNLGTILQAQGDTDSAEQLYRDALARNQAFALAYNNLGNILKERQEFDAAQRAFENALRFRPDFAEAACNLGSVLEQRGETDAALTLYRQAVSLRPEFAEAQSNLGSLLWRTGDREAAFRAVRAAVAGGPNFAVAHSQMGQMLLQCNRLEEAEAYCRRAVAIKPDFVEALGILANVVQLQGRLSEAVGLYREIIRLRPDNFVAYNDLGGALQEAMQLKDAKACYQQAVALNPDYAIAYCNLGDCCSLQEDPEGAIEPLRKAVTLAPQLHRAKMQLINQLQILCRWDDLEKLSREIIDVVVADKEQHFIAPFSFVGLPIPTTAEQQWKCAQNWGRNFHIQSEAGTSRHNSVASISRVVSKPDDGKLRIGYLSADFRKHAVGYMLPELFEKHDRNAFEVYGYAMCADDGSTIRRRLEAGCDVFRDIQKVSHRAAAEQIAADGIHILIDLQGFTGHSRPDILAMRPAPIQVSYIGYPGSMGVDFIDYILADDYVLPSDQQRFYTEKIVHLPGCYQVNDSRHEIAEYRPTRSECNLPEDAVVFCSFNTSYKYNPAMFDVWMSLLRRVPTGVLWLAERHASIRETLGREAQKRGVDPSRLIFAKIIPIAENLARQPLADLFLDSFPYNAHATASIALRMGVPLVTLSGDTLSTRVAGSLLRAVGMESLITRSFEEYESLAFRLATHRDELQAVRRQLADNLKTSSLFDGGRFAENVEAAYRTMWERHQQMP